MAVIESLSYEDLIAGKDLSDAVGRAFGRDGIGLLVVTGVQEMRNLRHKTLKLARLLSRLPPEELQKLERPSTHYCVGYSCGREKFKGRPDTAKASFYFNPIHESPLDAWSADTGRSAEELRSTKERYPIVAEPNTWPECVEGHPLHELREKARALGQLMHRVGMLVIKQCDRYVAKCTPSYPPDRLEATLRRSHLMVGRLLHYFPLQQQQASCGQSDANGLEASWCGWHNDNSTITALCPAIFIDDVTGEVVPSPAAAAPKSDPCGNTKAGLLVERRDGCIQQVSMGEECIGFQIGEASQIHTGGCLAATPHCVSAPPTPNTCRESLALFMEPNWDDCMSPPSGTSPADVIGPEKPSEKVPPLAERWVDGQTFGDFLKRSFERYYAHNNPN
ncbi:unnamed protein product [Vitrella brassicaformis CCMP3155]|uniref:Uncharacterized protein n=2 Tax=Vitrella brassicaformis TaxID=1169539 RepID=A0A0G4EM92_VITBC|nr:unnamed protein product [Vitrella brassicaformis CCMP3155]|eukprot:CEL97988.1 unnamed protein product [Vitrella brassicaformis CCMP3155]